MGTPGNQFFRSLVKALRVPYVDATKQDKAVFAMLLVRQIRRLNPPGRFLKLGEDNRYSDIGDKKAIEKTSQALREGAPEIDRLIQLGEIVVENVSHAACKLVLSFTLIDQLKISRFYSPFVA